MDSYFAFFSGIFSSWTTSAWKSNMSVFVQGVLFNNLRLSGLTDFGDRDLSLSQTPISSSLSVKSSSLSVAFSGGL